MTQQPETKSSGVRDSFAGGGVRDAEAGKPRFDLLRPVNVPYQSQMLTRFAALMGRGAGYYGDRNWEQMSDAAALSRFRSSAARHFEQWFAGEHDEDHAAAVFFNITGAEYVQGIQDGLWLPLEVG
ncbi:dATP/dGTP diphosphohydrolase domain-containing protein [Amycolatopsis kentuckyensis]|uniref:dATP/dGTP diphosphohydrolase domain-containing protein n=1 Tax=Amycolatopsis kentuckyensis TaxID=218823 RepID=UPI000A3BF51F|nr:dATP/dGTP diphosphohydrolase domain-containing protein [Amycolatopsis kentuckyensis]